MYTHPFNKFIAHLCTSRIKLSHLKTLVVNSLSFQLWPFKQDNGVLKQRHQCGESKFLVLITCSRYNS